MFQVISHKFYNICIYFSVLKVVFIFFWVSFIHPSITLIWFTLITFTLHRSEATFIHHNSFTLHHNTSIRSTFRRTNKLALTFIHPSRRPKHPYLRVNEGWTRLSTLRRVNVGSANTLKPMFLAVELTKLGEQNFFLGLRLIYF
jgi:hypothetical protein